MVWRLFWATALLAAPALAQTAKTPAPPQAPNRTSSFAITGPLTQGGWIRGVAPAGTVLVAINGSPLELEPDGTFFAAFDRDAPPQAELVARRGTLAAVRQTLTIAPRGWQVERINAPFHPPKMPDETFARIRAAELDRINSARRQGTGATGWSQNFIWPAAGRISGRFGAQRIYQGRAGSYHPGMDIAAGQGAPIMAPADGVVVLAASAPFTLEGMLLIVDHGAGLSSAFLHCSKLAVREGDPVRQGQTIGWVGRTGRATGPHLHWALKWREFRLDPLLFVSRTP